MRARVRMGWACGRHPSMIARMSARSEWGLDMDGRSVLTFKKAELSLVLRPSDLLLALPKSKQKARHERRCSAPRTAPLIHEDRPSMDYVETTALALARRMRVNRGPCVAARVRRNGRRLARTMRASSLRAHGRALSEPRSSLAHSQGRMPGERHTGGCFLLVTFLCTSKEKLPARPRASGSLALTQAQKSIPAAIEIFSTE